MSLALFIDSFVDLEPESREIISEVFNGICAIGDKVFC